MQEFKGAGHTVHLLRAIEPSSDEVTRPIMRLYEIHCPFHGTKETIEVPDSDDKNFDGEVACATLQPGSLPVRLKVKIVDDKLVSLEHLTRHRS